MKTHLVRTHPSAEEFPKEDQLAWKIAEVATDSVEVTDATSDMIVNRIIDNAAVAAASLVRRPVVNARAQAQSHPYTPGSTVFGIPGTFSPEWAAWANGVAVRELDFHDTFLAAEYSHPGDNIPPILAVAQHTGRDGRDLIRGLATGYEIQIDPGSGYLPARAQDRPRRTPRPLGCGRYRNFAGPGHRGGLPGNRPGAAPHDGDTSVPQGRDIQLEGVRACAGRQGCRRGGRPCDAR